MSPAKLWIFASVSKNFWWKIISPTTYRHPGTVGEHPETNQEDDTSGRTTGEQPEANQDDDIGWRKGALLIFGYFSSLDGGAVLLNFEYCRGRGIGVILQRKKSVCNET